MAIAGKFIGAGDLRETVIIQQFTETRTATGGVNYTASTIFTLRAKVEPVRGMEAAQLATADAKSDIRVTVRYRSGITTKNRLVWGGREYDIQSAPPLGIGAESRWLELMCVEHQA